MLKEKKERDYGYWILMFLLLHCGISWIIGGTLQVYLYPSDIIMVILGSISSSLGLIMLVMTIENIIRNLGDKCSNCGTRPNEPLIWCFKDNEPYELCQKCYKELKEKGKM
ncbi:MAG: hypothetical protein ACFFCI_00980 [Promethearchaeota archaeon]